MTLIVGVSAHFHDAACCVMRDGVLIAAAEEERFSKVKHDAGLPVRAFRYCLQAAGASISDIDCIGYYEDPVRKAGRQIWSALPDLLTDSRRRFSIDPGRAEAEIRSGFGYDGPLEFAEHHLSHAASAFYFSGFSDAAVLNVDGVGEWTTTSYGHGSGDALSLFEQVEFPDSLGLLYSAITAYLGFEVNEGEYKVMGLAPYGKPRFVEQVQTLIEVLPEGQFRLRMEYFDFMHRGRMFSERFCELFGAAPRVPESELEPFHADVAASMQRVLENILLDKVRFLYSRCPSENLCMAGGVALNCVANGRVRREGPFRNVFVQPAAGDAGGALGAAAIAFVRRTGTRPAREALRHVYLGPAYSGQEVRRYLARTPLQRSCQCYSGDEAGLIREVARRLAAGQVVGWFQGRMEFGPRALGARSILGDPRDPQMKERINSLVKLREGFRPFAPAVLEERATDHFALNGASAFMLETCAVTSALSLPAIAHVDGSARPQTVGARTNPRFHALLLEFERLTGCPILLNTSFNVRGDPIVLDPTDAVWTFVSTRIDALAIEDCLVSRDDFPAIWGDVAQMLDARRVEAREGRSAPNVYSFF